MKIMVLSLMFLGLVNSALAVDRAQLDGRIRRLAAQFEALQNQPEKRVPDEMLRKAKGIILMNRTKAGFMFAAESGGGVAMVKDHSGDWSPAAFIRYHGASFGFQAGGEQGFYVILLMNDAATHDLAESKVQFANEARGTAGNNSSGSEKNVSPTGDSMVVYSDRSGFYGGVAFKGGTLSPDQNANNVYYDRFVTLDDILFDNKVEPTEATKELTGIIEMQSRR